MHKLLRKNRNQMKPQKKNTPVAKKKKDKMEKRNFLSTKAKNFFKKWN